MKVVISIFILPQEISELDNIVQTLNKSVKYLNGDIDWFLDVGMTFSSDLIDWNKSTLTKSFFEDKFQKIEKRVDWCEKNFNIYTDINGALDFRRLKQEEYLTEDFVIWIDSDLIFDDRTLSIFEKAITDLSDTTNYLMITPEYVKLFDNSWDPVVNDKFLKEDNNYFRNHNPYIDFGIHGKISYEKVDCRSDVDKLQPPFRWGTGWFTCMSGDLYRKLKLPQSFGAYGPDDVYWWRSAFILQREYDYDVRQYKIKNLVVCELHRFRNNYEYTNGLKYYHRKNEYKKQCNDNITKELEKLLP